MLFALLLACAARDASPDEPRDVPASVTVVPGPWEGAVSVTAATTGPRDVAGRWSGPAIVLAAWVQPDGRLEFSTSFDGGRGWARPEVLAQGVQVEGPTRPRVALARGGAAIAFVAEGEPRLLRRGPEGWSSAPLAEGARARLLALGSSGGEPVAAWIDERGDRPALWASVEGRAEPVWEGGLCACCPPAVGEVGGEPAVAFRDLDETGVMEIRLLTRGLFGWEDRGRVTQTGWVPEACPGDGPSFDGEQLLHAFGPEGAREIWAGDRRLPASPGWDAAWPQRVEGVLLRLESTPERRRLVADSLPIIGSEGEIWPGDLAPLPGERLMTWSQGGRGHVAAFAPASIE